MEINYTRSHTQPSPSIDAIESKKGEWVKWKDLCPICREVQDLDVEEYYKDE